MFPARHALLILTSVASWSAPTLAQTWSAAHPEMPGWRDNYAAAVAEQGGENQVFVLGGYFDLAARDNVWRFHRTYGWSELGDMPGARRKAAAATIDVAGSERIHLVGGGYGSTAGTTTHWSYDPIADTWDTSPAPMVKSLYDMEAVAAPNGKLYVLGGMSHTHFTSNTVQIYDPDTDSWTAGYHMPQKRTRFAAVTDCDGYIYVFGGIDGSTYRNTVECFDTSTNTWLTENPHTEDPMPDIPTPRDGLAGALGRDGRIYLTGGNSSTGPFALNVVEAYDPYTNTWSTEPGMLVAREGHRAVGLGSRVWVPGGNSHMSMTNVLESYGALVLKGACSDDVPTLPILHGGSGMVSATGIDWVSSIVDYQIGINETPWFVFDVVAGERVALDLDVAGQGALRMTVFDAANHIVAMGSDTQSVMVDGTNAPAGRYYVQLRQQGQGQGPIQYALAATRSTDPRPVGEAYASPAIVNSSGTPASIGAQGLELAAANNLTLEVSGLPQNSAGYFLVSRQAGQIVNPGTSLGVLPLSGNIGRFAGNVLNSGATGHVSLGVDLTQIPGNPPAAAQAGETWHFTYWYRDAGPNGVTSHFSDGLRIEFE